MATPTSRAVAIAADRTVVLAGAGSPHSTGAQPDGSIIVDVYTGLIRLTPMLVVDPSFGTGGRAAFPPAPTFRFVRAGIGIDDAGRILVPGSSDAGGVVLRYTPSGAIDTSFGTGGIATVPRIADETIVADPGGGVLVTGVNAQHTGAVLARLTPTGQLDTAFATAGVMPVGGRLTGGQAIIDPPGVAAGPNGAAVVAVSGLAANCPPVQLGCWTVEVDVVSAIGAVVTNGLFALQQQPIAGPGLVDPASRVLFPGLARLLGAGLDPYYGAGACGQVMPDNNGPPVALPDGRAAEINPFGSVLFFDANGHPDKTMGPGGYVNLPGLPLTGVANASTLYVFGEATSSPFDLQITPVALTPGTPLPPPGLPSNATGPVLFTADGGATTQTFFGGPTHSGPPCGSMAGLPLAQPVVSGSASPDGVGYWLVARDGGVFAFGDAAFYGSTGAIHLNQPVVGMASTPSGHGYWLAGADGGIFTFGDAPFLGSALGDRTQAAVVAILGRANPTYSLVRADGSQCQYGVPGNPSAFACLPVPPGLPSPVIGAGVG